MGYAIRILNRVKDRKTTIKTYLCGVIFQEQPKSIQEEGICIQKTYAVFYSEH